MPKKNEIDLSLLDPNEEVNEAAIKQIVAAPRRMHRAKKKSASKATKKKPGQRKA